MLHSNKSNATGGKGRSNYERLSAAYPQSPAYIDENNDENTHKLLQKELLEGVVKDGHMFASYDRDFNGDGEISPPDYAGVDVEGANLSNPFMPNLGSPGKGSFDDSQKPAPSEFYKDTEAIKNDNFGSGEDITQRTPAKTSSKMALGNPSSLIKGKSPAS